MRIVAIAISIAALVTSSAPKQAHAAGPAVISPAGVTDFSAAKRRNNAVRAEPDTSFAATRAMTHGAGPAQIACLPGGCQPVPRGCLREPGRTLGGEPSGFDAIACPPR